MISSNSQLRIITNPNTGPKTFANLVGQNLHRFILHFVCECETAHFLSVLFSELLVRVSAQNIFLWLPIKSYYSKMVF